MKNKNTGQYSNGTCRCFVIPPTNGIRVGGGVY